MSGNLYSKPEGMNNLDQDFPPVEPEACFQVPESGELELDLPHVGSSISDYLTFCIIRNPADLISHMRRIILLGKIGDSEELYAALIDLFITLGSKGKALRSRLLQQYRSRLTPAQHTTLSQSSKQGITVVQSPLSSASVLAKGITGTCSLIRPITDTRREEKSSDPLQEARKYIEYSQIDAAREVLERAVLENPERIELQKELLELYRAGRDVENFQKIFRELHSSGIPISDDWSAASEFFSETA
jgi:hypothetical protein